MFGNKKCNLKVSLENLVETWLATRITATYEGHPVMRVSEDSRWNKVIKAEKELTADFMSFLEKFQEGKEILRKIDV